MNNPTMQRSPSVVTPTMQRPPSQPVITVPVLNASAIPPQPFTNVNTIQPLPINSTTVPVTLSTVPLANNPFLPQNQPAPLSIPVTQPTLINPYTLTIAPTSGGLVSDVNVAYNLPGNALQAPNPLRPMRGPSQLQSMLLEKQQAENEALQGLSQTTTTTTATIITAPPLVPSMFQCLSFLFSYLQFTFCSSHFWIVL
jgi:hypothetical protein